MSGYWIWLQSEISLNTRGRCYWKWNFREEEGERERGRERERDGRGFSEVDEWGCACWQNNAEIYLDVDLIQKGDGDLIMLISQY